MQPNFISRMIPLQDLREFKLSDNDYQGFMNFVMEHDFEYRTSSTEMFERA